MASEVGSEVRAASDSVNSWSGAYLEAQHESWKRDPSSVSADLDAFFRGFELGARDVGAPAVNGAVPAAPAGSAPPSSSDLAKAIAVADLVRAYRAVGHLAAQLDPFGRERPAPAALDPAHYGLSDADLDRVYPFPDVPGKGSMTLRAALDLLRETYTRSIGVEYQHICRAEEREWMGERLERDLARLQLTGAQREHVLLQLHKAELFETFLHKRYVGQKRFSLEGGESLIALLDWIVQQAPKTGVEELVMGMPHRGRLNVLKNILGKTYEQIFTEFEDAWDKDFDEGGGDVKYHLGFSGDRETEDGEPIRVVLGSNPSHLESVDGVVLGRTRAKQRLRSDEERTKTVPILIHGDAAFIGQGVVQEVLNFSQLPGYTTGGCIHVIVNNLIGFTTGPDDARSSPYCSDVVKMIEAPVIHVNGEDPEAVVYAAQVALEYRQTFKRDIVIDMWCYRKYGHNEGDDPSFTQPVMAALIKKKPSTLRIYAERLLSEGVIDEARVEQIRDSLHKQMEKAQSSIATEPHDPTIDPGSWRWEGYGNDYSFEPVNTTAPRELIDEAAEAISRTPEGFTPHRMLAKQLEKRTRSILDDEPMDWGAVEALTFGTLLLEGNAVRLSGQDSRRGTFSHRHAVLRDEKTGDPYVPLNHMREMGRPGITGEEPGDPGTDGRPRQARACIYDSPLSEYGVLAFEYGYSLADPRMLVVWEAQFGDFCNGAQIVIDQYIASAEHKWQRWSGLVLLLPHGYEGQGPEHSSARLERFLKLCADDNIQVIYPTTPAQQFHALRRQLRRTFRKPLVVMSPKSLLRHPRATSRVAELTDGGFQEILDDPTFESAKKAAGASRLILCSGKVYYDLVERREQDGREEDVAVVRVEQLYPLHADRLGEIASRYPSAERVWVQEESKNAGAYTFFNQQVRDLLDWSPLPYIGREASPTPATGSKKQHTKEQDALLKRAVAAPAPATTG